MSDDSLDVLQAQIRTIFGVHAGAMDECEPWPESPRSGEPVSAAYLDYCTHNAHRDATRATDRTVVPTSVGDSIPWGGAFTDVTLKRFADGSIDVAIIERPANYRPVHTRLPRETFGAGLKREEVMDPESRKRSAIRAKVNVRRACSQIVADRLITHTFRDNVVDVDASWTIFADFLKLYKAEMPYQFWIGKQRYKVASFDYVCVPETQKRGAVHFHIATNRPHDVNRLRKCWQAAQARAGLANPDGNVNIKKQFTRSSGWSTTNSRNCARYLSKYIHKSFGEGLMFRKRYSVSHGIAEPEIQRLYFIEVYTTEELLAYVSKKFNVRCERTGFGKAGPYEAAFATFVPP